MTPEPAFPADVQDFIDRTRADLAFLAVTVPPGRYASLVAYFAGFFSEEDRRVNPGAEDEDEED